MQILELSPRDWSLSLFWLRLSSLFFWTPDMRSLGVKKMWILGAQNCLSPFLAPRLSLTSSLSLSSSSFFWLLCVFSFFSRPFPLFVGQNCLSVSFGFLIYVVWKQKMSILRAKKCNFHPLFSFFSPLSLLFSTFPSFHFFWLLDFFCSEPGFLNIHNFQPLQHRGRNDNWNIGDAMAAEVRWIKWCTSQS